MARIVLAAKTALSAAHVDFAHDAAADLRLVGRLLDDADKFVSQSATKVGVAARDLDLETSMDVTFQFELIKGKRIRWPRIENGEYIMATGSVRPLMDAFRIAQVELIDWLVDDYGFEKWEAFQVVSQVGVTRVANAVDPNYTIVAKFPKKYLPKN
jgi:acetamidase/formamidase